MKENTKSVLNRILTVVVILLAALCIFLAVKIITGHDASIFGYQVYHIMTGSMEPTIPTGSTVITRKVDPYTLEEGDIISFVSRDDAIYGNVNTHRIIGIDDSDGERKFVTKGDANGTMDSVEVQIPDIKGKVIFHANFRAFSAFLDFMRTGYGFVTVICFPFIFILWQISVKLKREIKEYAEETARAEAELELAKEKAAEAEAEEASKAGAAEESGRDEEAKALDEMDFEKLKQIQLEKLRKELQASENKAGDTENTQEQDDNEERRADGR